MAQGRAPYAHKQKCKQKVIPYQLIIMNSSKTTGTVSSANMKMPYLKCKSQSGFAFIRAPYKRVNNIAILRERFEKETGDNL